MAKPTYSIGGLDFATAARVEAFLQGTPGIPAAPAAPVVPLALPTTASPLPPSMPVAPLAPPAPPAPAAPIAPPAPPAPASGPTQMDVITAMQRVVGLPGGAGKASAIVAQYNAAASGTPGPITVVDPVQYGNIIAAFNAVV